FRLARLRRIRLLQIGEQDLRMQSAIRENNRLQLACKQFLGYPRGFIDIAAPNAEVSINHRRIIENEKFFPSRCAILLDHVDFALDQLRGQLAGVCNRSGTADELRIRTVEPRDASQSSQHIRKMASEYPAIV